MNPLYVLYETEPIEKLYSWEDFVLGDGSVQMLLYPMYRRYCRYTVSKRCIDSPLCEEVVVKEYRYISLNTEACSHMAVNGISTYGGLGDITRLPMGRPTPQDTS